MKRGDLREHWQSQAFMAMLGVSMTSLVAIIMGAGGLMLSGQPHPFAELILALCAGLLAVEIALGIRVLYCIYKYRKVGR